MFGIYKTSTVQNQGMFFTVKKNKDKEQRRRHLVVLSIHVTRNLYSSCRNTSNFKGFMYHKKVKGYNAFLLNSCTQYGVWRHVMFFFWCFLLLDFFFLHWSLFPPSSSIGWNSFCLSNFNGSLLQLCG